MGVLNDFLFEKMILIGDNEINVKKENLMDN